MLVLTRQVDEVVMIGDDIRIKIIEVRGDKVRIGFEAPPNVPVHRLEVYNQIKKQGERK